MSAQRASGTRSKTTDPGGCHYIPRLLAVPVEARAPASTALGRAGFGVEDATERTLVDVLGDFPGETPLGLLDVNENPHSAARYLASLDKPIAASPIHGVGYEGHGGFMSGAGHGPSRKKMSAPKKCESEGMVAVIDSGVVKEDLRPDWMGATFVDAESIDIEVVPKGGASHGTFVSSVIRRLAPNQGIAFAAARPDVGGRMTSHHKGKLIDPPTDELEVLGAVARLVRRFGDRPSDIAALNLSLGATRCGPNDGFLLTLRTALDIWRRSFGYDTPIFAAGGNSPSLEPVYPAAFPWVRAVAAADRKGQQVVWRNERAEAPLHRTWITDVAPGVKIHGLSGASQDDTVWWSGSSFATAIATSQSVTDQPFEVDSSVTLWRDRNIDYSLIDGLEHG